MTPRLARTDARSAQSPFSLLQTLPIGASHLKHSKFGKHLGFAPDRIDKHGLGRLAAPPPFLLPTPLTVGTGRKVRPTFATIKPSVKSKGLTAQLLSLADEDVQQSYARNQETVHAQDPVTPPPKPRIEQIPVFEPFANSPEDDVVFVSMEELDKIPKRQLSNPFLSLALPEQPLDTDGAPVVDYSTHLELVNHRTGERRVEQLSDEQRTMRPRKLDFSLAELVPVKVNNNITNRYLENTLGLKFSMSPSLAKNSMGFDIFSSSPP